MDQSAPVRPDPERPVDPRAFLPPQPGTERSQPGQSGVQFPVEFPVSVVLPAGGSGERTGLRTPKQFCSLMGRPLISYTAQAFERVRWIQSVVVVVAKENLALMRDIVQKYRHSKVLVVPGGSTRHRSIRRGVEALGEAEEVPRTPRPTVVIVHDAVRPFVEEELLFQITMAAKEHGAAGAIRPLVSTVIASSSDGFLEHSLERAKYRASEMPQAFTHEVITRAYQRCTDYDLDFGTECLHLALQYCGTNAKLIEGPPTLWKVTYKRDLAAAESIIKESLSQSCCCLTGASPSALSVASALQKTFETLHTDLVVIPDLLGENSKHLLREWNFIQTSVDGSLSEVKTLLSLLQTSDRALLNPVVVVWVNLSEDVSSITETATDPAAMIRDLASAAKLENLLLYGVHVQLCQDPQLRERAVSRLAEVTSALIQDRSQALVGQILQV